MNKDGRPPRPKQVRLMLDSGAYSVWTLGMEIPLGDYIGFIQANLEHIETYINMDVIPGTPGGQPTHTSIELAAKAGWDNLCRMRKEGLEPMGVYHVGERRYWLEKMIGEGVKYIGLGGVAKVRDGQRRAWLDSVFGHLCRGGGFPPVKVHGLGITSIDLVHRYPWATTDSISWVGGSQRGSIIVPKAGKDGYDYLQSPFEVRFAESKGGEPNIDAGRCYHYRSLGASMKKYVDTYLEAEGFEVPKLKANYWDRLPVNLRFYLRSAKAHPKSPFVPRVQGLMTDVSGEAIGTRAPDYKYRIVFVTGADYSFNVAMNNEGAKDRLISYVKIEGREDLGYYMRYGHFPPLYNSSPVLQRVRVWQGV